MLSEPRPELCLNDEPLLSGGVHTNKVRLAVIGACHLVAERQTRRNRDTDLCEYGGKSLARFGRTAQYIAKSLSRKVFGMSAEAGGEVAEQSVFHEVFLDALIRAP
jgi:hypothetical protein